MPKRAKPSTPAPSGAPGKAKARARKAADEAAPAMGSKPTPRRTARPEPVITIRSDGGASMTVALGTDLKSAAVEWSRAVRNRARWATQEDAREDQGRRARETLAGLHLDMEAVRTLADERVVQVSIPFIAEDDGWEARIFPWEYILTSALRDVCKQPMLVVRHLLAREGDRKARRATGTPVTEEAPTKALILESAPGGLRDSYTFESERRLVAAKLRPIEVEVLPDPSPEQARQHIARLRPDAIHLAGFDTHQGATLLGLDDIGLDGYLMTDDLGRPKLVFAEQLANLLNAGDGPVRLAAFNFQNSAARVAAMAVAGGAHAAIGFQDRVEDAVAEIFFASFYAHWRDAGWNTFGGFERAMRSLLASRESLSGTGIVLWSALDILANLPAVNASDTPAPPPPVRGKAPVRRGARPTPATPVVEEQDVPGVASIVSSIPDVWVTPRLIDRVNYSRLHNRRGLFDSFVIHNSTGETVEGIELQVVLYSGTESFPYRRRLQLSTEVTELGKDIRVPLTSTLLRSLDESVQSVVYVTVKRDQQTLFENTFPVELIAIEEWGDIEADDMWLPSFVLPRDPAVDEIVVTARALLRGLRDQRDAAFDGYQSIDQNATDPYALVDQQVQALWSTLSFHYGLNYINPPPTYSPRAQRLRSPSSILASRAGTCVDLALLVAACLELIDIYPVLVLYQGHASVGYWRGDDLHQAFQVVAPSRLAREAGAGPDVEADRNASDASTVPWVMARQSTQNDPTTLELRGMVGRGDLSLLESTLITKQDGFTQGMRAGADGLTGRRFRSLVDVQIARRHGITPLPISRG
jgi:hypothetical protein